MIYFTMLHWLVVGLFVLLFLILTVLSLREKKRQTVLTMIFSSFLLTVTAAIISLIVLDKYTKKAKIVTYTTQYDLARESAIVRGILQNVGKYDIGYCNLEVRVSRNPSGGRATSYFTSTKSLDFMGKTSGKKSSVTVEEQVSGHLKPGEKKKFYMTVRVPGYFENPKYYLKLHCH